MKENLFNITLDNLSGTMMLTIEPKEEMKINDFCCEMIKKTNVYGLLKLNVTTINGEIKFNYDLSKKKTIAEFAKAGFNEAYGRRILYNLAMSFLKLNEFYLKPNYCLLNPEYTYIGDGLNVYVPYIPIKYVKTEPNELKEYFSELLSKYFAVEGVAAYDEMFKYVFQCQTLDLSHFISKFLSSEEQSQNNFAAEKQEKLANKMPLPNQEPVKPIQPQVNIEKNFEKINISNNEQQVKQSGLKIPGFGEMKIPGGEIKMPGGGEMKIPGMGGMKMPGGDSKPQNIEKEKKGLFGLGGKKPIPEQPIPNMQNSFVPNQNVPSQNMNNQNFINNNQQFNNPQMPPRNFNVSQHDMNKTIMIDGNNLQAQNMNMSGGMAYLKYRGQNVPINDTEFVIGKANNQFKINFAINDNPHISRKHASILVSGNSYFIRDEGSTNGTYVNGRSIPKMVPQSLNNGDEISLYDEVFIFCM